MSSLHIGSRKKARWGNDEIRSLKDQLKAGIMRYMVHIPGRTRAAIDYKARDLKLASATRWSKDETKKLRREIKAGKSPRQIRIVNPVTGERRSAKAVRVRAVRRRMVKKIKPRVPWSGQEIALLRRLIKNGYTPRMIKQKGLFGPGRVSKDGHKLPARGVNALAKMVQRLRLGNSVRSERASEGRRHVRGWLLQELNAFIRRNGKILPAAEIAKMFGISPSAIRRRRKKLRVKVTWHDAAKMEKSRFQDPELAQARSDATKRSWQARRARMAQES